MMRHTENYDHVWGKNSRSRTPKEERSCLHVFSLLIKKIEGENIQKTLLGANP